MKKILSLAVAAVLATGALAACGDEAYASDNYVGVCMDRNGNRVDDSYCRNALAYSNGPSATDAFVWGYLLSTLTMPRYGSHVDHVVYRVDESRYNVYRGGVPRNGGLLNPTTYKPTYSKVTKSTTSLTSKDYRNTYIQQDSTYKQKSSSKNNTYNYKSGSGTSGYKSGGGTTYKSPSRR